MRYRIIQRVVVMGMVIALCVGGLGLLPPLVFAQKMYVQSEQLHPLAPRPQATPNNTVLVESGIVSIANNTKVEFNGGNSPQFSVVNSATPAESRIDLLVMNSSGTLPYFTSPYLPSSYLQASLTLPWFQLWMPTEFQVC